MHRLTKDEKSERERQDHLYSEARRTKQQEVDNHILQLFFFAHRSDGVCLQANVDILVGYLKRNALPVTAENLELAYRAEADNLAYRTTDYVRQTEAGVPLAQRRPGPPTTPTPVVLPFTADEIKAMSSEQLRNLMRRPEYRDELNRILAVKI